VRLVTCIFLRLVTSKFGTSSNLKIMFNSCFGPKVYLGEYGFMVCMALRMSIRGRTKIAAPPRSFPTHLPRDAKKRLKHVPILHKETINISQIVFRRAAY
jgi:hypothetical protein